MHPRLLLAPAGHGKTENLVRRIRQLLADEPFAPVIVVAPSDALYDKTASNVQEVVARVGRASGRLRLTHRPDTPGPIPGADPSGRVDGDLLAVDAE